MSHSTTLVCLPKGTDPDQIDEALAEALAPFDENTDVEPYRQYEEGGPEDYWWVRAMRRGAAHHRDGTGIQPHYPDDPHGFKPEHRSSSRFPEDVQRAELADDALWAERLGEHPTWEDVVRLYNEKYHPANALALAGDSADDERLLYDPESGRAYTMSRYNPKSRWDWWVVGGRWRWSLMARRGVDRSALVLTELRGGDPIRTNQMEIEERMKAGLPLGPDYGPNGGLWCDGAPRGLLDFDAMRGKAEEDAHAEFDAWEAFWNGLPAEARDHALPWSYFRDLAECGGCTSGEAREAYRVQPWVTAAKTRPGANMFGGCELDRYGFGRDEFAARARLGAVPGYALLTLEGEWLEPGRMGWFGMSSANDDTREAYHVEANRYLDELDPEAWIVLVDVHI